VEKYGTARQATDNNIMRHRKMRFVCWITKATNKHSGYLLIFRKSVKKNSNLFKN